MDRELVLRLARAWHQLDFNADDAARLAAELQQFETTAALSAIAYDVDPTIDYRCTLLAGAADGKR